MILALVLFVFVATTSTVGKPAGEKTDLHETHHVPEKHRERMLHFTPDFDDAAIQVLDPDVNDLSTSSNLPFKLTPTNQSLLVKLPPINVQPVQVGAPELKKTVIEKPVNEVVSSTLKHVDDNSNSTRSISIVVIENRTLSPTTTSGMSSNVSHPLDKTDGKPLSPHVSIKKRKRVKTAQKLGVNVNSSGLSPPRKIFIAPQPPEPIIDMSAVFGLLVVSMVTIAAAWMTMTPNVFPQVVEEDNWAPKKFQHPNSFQWWHRRTPPFEDMF